MIRYNNVRNVSRSVNYVVIYLDAQLVKEIGQEYQTASALQASTMMGSVTIARNVPTLALHAIYLLARAARPTETQHCIATAQQEA